LLNFALIPEDFFTGVRIGLSDFTARDIPRVKLHVEEDVRLAGWWVSVSN
jgi:hypothetical protein